MGWMKNNDDSNKLLEVVSAVTDYGTLKTSKKKVQQDEKVVKTNIFLVRKYLTRLDITLMVIGLLFAVLSGMILPILGLFFGGMTNTFISQAINGLASDEQLATGLAPLDGTPVLVKYNQTLMNPFEINGTVFYKVAYVIIEVFRVDNALVELMRNDSFTAPLSVSEFQGSLNKYMIIYLVIGTIMLLSSFFQTLCWENTSENLVHTIRKEYFSQIIRQDISWYDQNDNGNLSNKLADDSERIREGTGYKVAMVIQYTSTLIAGIGVGFLVNAQLTLLILCVTPFLIALMGYTYKFSATSMAREQEKYAAAGAVAEDALSNIKTVNAFGGQPVEVDRYQYWLEEGRKFAMKKYNMFSVCIGFTFLIMYGAYALGFAYGSYLVQMGISTPGSVFTVFFSVVVGAVSLGNCLPFLNIISGAIGVLSSVHDVIQRPVVVDPYSKEGRKCSRMTGRIEFKGVSFVYPTRPDVKILDELNLTIEPGKKVAIVGSSGAGKSTIISLILRFYDPVDGEVCIDGIAIKDYNISALRKQIGLVSQEPVLFGVSVAENISYGADNVTQTEIIEAATQANAHDFILKLPQGYETLVGDTGSQLSGGQKQRIAIARALVRDPKILLLDEATSALDARSEGVVQDTLERAMKGRTTVVVAHRLSTVRHADIICVMQNGKLFETGTHDELMGKRSVYYDLVQAQMSRCTPSIGNSSGRGSVTSLLNESEDNNTKVAAYDADTEQVTGSTQDTNGGAYAADDDGKINLEGPRKGVIPSLKDGWKVVDRDHDHEESDTSWKVLDRQVSTKTVSEDDDDEYETIITTVRETREILYSDEEDDDEAASNSPEKEVIGTDVFGSDLLRSGRELSPSTTTAEEKKRILFSKPEASEKEITIWQLLKMQRTEWPWLLLGVISVIGSGLVTPIFAIYYGAIFKVFTLTGLELYLASKFWTYMFVGFAIFVGVIFAAQTKGMTEANEKLIARSRALVFQNILRQPVGWFDLDSSSPGILVNRLARNAPLIKSAAGMRAGQVLSSAVTLVSAFIIAFVCGWKLAIILALIVPIIIGLSFKQQHVLNRNVCRDVKIMDNAGRIASETVRNIRTVQSLAQEKLFTQIYTENLELPYRESKKQAFLYSMLFGITQGLMYYMYAIAFRIGGYLVETGDLTAEDMYRVFFALSLCATAVGTAFLYMQDYNKARVSVRMLNYLMTRKSEIDPSSTTGAKPPILGTVEFRGVHFSYPTRPDLKVLKGLSFTVGAGKTLALVGESGCGKSTVISLLERFYDPLSGSILVEDYETRALNLAYLRANIGLVTQEPILFDTTIRENIAYGALAIQKDVQFEQVKKAAEIANIHNFIMNLPERYDTMVGERGVQLSGGQKQRVAIARALIRDPKILLLDEATSALDTESEKIVQAALDEAKQGRTCIVIAHRLSTIQNADTICVVHKGIVVESGTHSELLELKGQYYQLTQRQNL